MCLRMYLTNRIPVRISLLYRGLKSTNIKKLI